MGGDATAEVGDFHVFHDVADCFGGYFGVFVGVRRRSNELLVATKDGIKDVRSVKRIPVEQ